MAELLLVRHGELQFNKPEKFWGHSDIKLSPAGIRQAELLRQRLADRPIHIAYSSTLSRTRRTAEIIAAPHNIPVTACHDLDEINFGEFEGLTFCQIKKTDPDTARLLTAWDVRPRFPGGESLDELDHRVRSFISGTDLSGDKRILIVAHAGTLRMLICNLLGLEVRHWRKLRVDPGSLSILHTFSELNILTGLNDVCHLRAEHDRTGPTAESS